MKFRESALAHKYLDGLTGVEIGGSAHNPFGIKGCRNVDYTDDMNTVFKCDEEKLCNEKLAVDIVAEGDNLPLENECLDYVLSSHVFEHFYDPISTLSEWLRVIKPGGYIFMIIPHKERTFDSELERTTLDELLKRHSFPEIVDMGDRSKHWSIWITEDVIEFCKYLKLNVVDWMDVDDKVGNGFTIVIRK